MGQRDQANLESNNPPRAYVEQGEPSPTWQATTEALDLGPSANQAGSQNTCEVKWTTYVATLVVIKS
jgi:hypothetical protein